MTVQESIESAFAEVPYPGDDGITDDPDCPACCEIRDYFRGTTWRGHTAAKIPQYQPIYLPLMPAATHYFLPAYMLASLGAWAEAGDIPRAIVQLCQHPPPDDTRDWDIYDRFSLFTRPQRAAIAAYLQEWERSEPRPAGAEEVPALVERLLSDNPATPPGPESERPDPVRLGELFNLAFRLGANDRAAAGLPYAANTGDPASIPEPPTDCKLDRERDSWRSGYRMGYVIGASDADLQKRT